VLAHVEHLTGAVLGAPRRPAARRLYALHQGGRSPQQAAPAWQPKRTVG
jgi:hypothetical protein